MVTKITFSTTIDAEVTKKFKEICREGNVNQSMLIEAFMRTYIEGEISLVARYNKEDEKMITMVRTGA